MTAAIRAQFDRCRAWLEPAITIDNETTPDALLADLIAGRAQLWPGAASCIVTQCVLAPHGPSIHGWLGGGDLADLVSLTPGIEAFGRAMGCEWATIEGRRGWARVYGPFGYVLDGEGVLRKRL